MPTFLFSGYDAQGQKAGGSLFVENRVRAERELRRRGITDYEIYVSKTELNARNSISSADKAAFCRAASELLATNMSRAERFALIAEKTENRCLKNTAEEISVFISKGHLSTHALAMYDHFFDHFAVRVLTVGESEGRLRQTYDDLERFYEHEVQFDNIMRRYFLYPVKYAYGLLRGWLPGVHLGMDRLLVSLPFIKRVVITLCTSRVARGIVLLMDYGIPIQAFGPVLPPMAVNRAVENKLVKMCRQVRSGQDAASVLEITRYYPPHFPETFQDMAIAGLKQGNFNKQMRDASVMYTAEAERMLKRAGLWFRAFTIALAAGFLLAAASLILAILY